MFLKVVMTSMYLTMHRLYLQHQVVQSMLDQVMALPCRVPHQDIEQCAVGKLHHLIVQTPLDEKQIQKINQTEHTHAEIADTSNNSHGDTGPIIANP